MKETFKERLKKKLELTIIGMPRATIVKVIDLATEIEENMPTPCKSR